MRILFLVSALALALAGCATTPVTPGTNPTPTPVPTVSQVANDVALIASGLHNAIPFLTAPVANPGLPLPVAQQIEGYIGDIQTAAAAFATAPSGLSQQQLVTQIQGYLQLIAQAATASGQALPPQFLPYLAAATALLPVIEIALGMPAPTAARARDILSHA